jgi:hypothetical protein
MYDVSYMIGDINFDLYFFENNGDCVSNENFYMFFVDDDMIGGCVVSDDDKRLVDIDNSKLVDF